MDVDVSVIMPAHHEGRMVHPTIRSIFRTVDHAAKNGIRSEIIIVTDRPDAKTKAYFKQYENSETIAIEDVDFGDPGLARNHGVSVSKGKYVTFVDADNLLGSNWIDASFDYLEKIGGGIVAHPEYHVVFDSENTIWKQVSSFDPAFDPRDFFEFNYWDVVCTVEREILLRYPHQPTMSTPAYGYEDWHFNCETIADGIAHHVVPQTAHFRRSKKTGSVFAASYEAGRVLRPSKLFEPAVLASIIGKKDLAEGVETDD